MLMSDKNIVNCSYMAAGTCGMLQIAMSAGRLPIAQKCDHVDHGGGTSVGILNQGHK